MCSRTSSKKEVFKDFVRQKAGGIRATEKQKDRDKRKEEE